MSYNLITIARKSKKVPQLQEMIRSQEITVSNARMIAPVLSPENQDRWLASAAELTKRELEKEIAKEFPGRLVQERARYVSEKHIELKLGISEDTHELLKRSQDIVSFQAGKAATLEETLKAALELFIEKKDPIAKAQRSEKRELSRPSPAAPVPGQVSSNPRFIPAKLEHAVRLRDQGRCTYHSAQGMRCSERRWLDIHHVKPLSEGGKTSLDNLTLVCRGHHQVIHRAPRQFSEPMPQQISMFRFG